MKVETPVLTRCCFCLPLRYGVLAFAYIHMILSGPTFALDVFRSDGHFTTTMLFWAYAMILVSNFILSIILIIGCHMKNYRLFSIYFYGGIFTVLLLALLICVKAAGDIHYIKIDPYFLVYTVGDATFHVSYILLQLYLIVLVHGEMRKLRGSRERVEFVNNAVEAEARCALTTEDVV